MFVCLSPFVCLRLFIFVRPSTSMCHCTHLVSHSVKIVLELVLHVSGKVCAAVFQFFHVISLAVTGEVKGQLVRKHVVDPAQEIPGHRVNAIQRMSKILFALPG